MSNKIYVSFFVSSIVVLLMAIISLIDDGLSSIYEVLAIFPMYVFTLVVFLGVPLSFLIDFLTRNLSKNKSTIKLSVYLFFGLLVGLLFLLVFPEIVPLTVATGLIVAGLFYSGDLYIKNGGKRIIKYISVFLVILVFTLNILSFIK